MTKITLEQIKEEQEKVNELVRKYEEQERQKEKETYELELPVWFKNAKYFFVNSSGGVDTDSWDAHFIDEKRYELGNFFEAQEEAELEIERRKLMTRFNQFRDKCNREWNPDFADEREVKHCIIRQRGEFNVYCCWVVEHHTKFGYFKNKKDCERAIELFGEEIKELF